jgi:hypothetical protein
MPTFIINKVKMQNNARAFRVLLILIMSALAIFFAENKFLVAENRGQALSQYQSLSWKDDIILLAEDFENLKSEKELEKENFFAYGSVQMKLDSLNTGKGTLGSKTCCKIVWKGEDKFGGWGKGIGKNIDLDRETDYLNFRILYPAGRLTNDVIKVILEEDDNDDGILQKELDDSFSYTLNLKPSDKWQFISIPLKEFYDSNPGGDSLLNVTRKGGLHTIIFTFEQPDNYKKGDAWYFDFICFSKVKINESQF